MSYFISAHVGDTLGYLFPVATDLDLGPPSSMTALTIFETDLAYLGNVQNYTGCIANGGIERLHSLWVEIRFVGPERLVPWGPGHGLWNRRWYGKSFSGVDRLSGAGMRQHFFFGTSPGNAHVAVVENGVIP